MHIKEKIMDNKTITLIEKIAQQSQRRTVGRTIQKELSAHTFIASLFKNFTIMGERSLSEASMKAKIQDIVNNNLSHSGCRSHAQEFSLDGFLHDLKKEFTLSLKSNTNE
jgi:hypothetical protein